jgi:hypothetical protein
MSEQAARLPELIIKAHAEAIKRFYDDKAFAMKAYTVCDKQSPLDVEKMYDLYAKVNTYERVPLCFGSGSAIRSRQPHRPANSDSDAPVRLPHRDR